jgi:hypothetical protein
MNADIKKGSRIRADWIQVNDPPSSLAGCMPKFGASGRSVTGVVRHVRGDHPTTPTVIFVYVDPDGPWDGPTVTPHGCTCDHKHVQVDPKHIVEVLP